MEESSGVTLIASDHKAGGTRLETLEAEGSVILPSGADPSAERQTKGADPRTRTLRDETCFCPGVLAPSSPAACVLSFPARSCPTSALVVPGSPLVAFSLFSSWAAPGFLVGDSPRTDPFP